MNVSTPFARRLGFQDAVFPFSMMLFLTGGMTHADSATVQLGYSNATYHWPAFSKDTITREFTLKSRRNTSDGKNSICTFDCVLRNQRGKILFTTDKTMLFSNTITANEALRNLNKEDENIALENQYKHNMKMDFYSHQENKEKLRKMSNSNSDHHHENKGIMQGPDGYGAEDDGDNRTVEELQQAKYDDFMMEVSKRYADSLPRKDGWRLSTLEEYIIESVGRLNAIGESQSLTPLRPGQLLLHTTSRPISSTQLVQLSSLCRLTHPRHFNHHVYNVNEIFVPGGLVVGLTVSAANRDLHEVLHEDLVDCHFINNVHPGDTVGAISYVQTLEENVGGDLEAVFIRTIGVKNIDVGKDLIDVKFPSDLFVRHHSDHTYGTDIPFSRSKVEALCAEKCPELSNRIVSVLDRRIVRQTPQSEAFLL
jgi:acyl dehydratase